MISQLTQTMPRWVTIIMEQAFFTITDRNMQMHAIAGTVTEWFWHIGTNHAQFIGDLAGRHLEHNEVICTFEAICVGIVNLELAISVFMVNLINIQTDFNQRFR